MLKTFTRISLLAVLSASSAMAQQLIANGGFSSGFTGWSHGSTNGGPCGNDFSVISGSSTPSSGHSTAGPISGNYAVSDENCASNQLLSQSFAVTPGGSETLSFDMFVNHYADYSNCDGSLIYGCGNEFARVDILSGSAGADDTGAGVLASL